MGTSADSLDAVTPTRAPRWSPGLLAGSLVRQEG